MSTHFANRAPQSGLALAAPGAALPPLEALPWLEPAGPASRPGDNPGGASARAGTSGLSHGGFAGAAAALIAGVWLLTGTSILQPAPSAEPQSAPSGVVASAPRITASLQIDDAPQLAASDAEGVEVPGSGSTSLAGAPPRSAEPARAKPATGRQLAARMPVAVPQPAPKPFIPAQQVLVTGAASGLDQVPPPSTESAVASATQRQFRATTSKARDAARDVIRLGERRRPGRNASAHEETGYRLRQQNAEAARTYLAYLDTLARSMKGTTTETVAQQSLAKARQTLGYLDAMEADSQASLR
jgi:hypothetical protein